MSVPFYKSYIDLVERLLGSRHYELNKRTGVGITVGDPTSFTIDLSDDLLPMCGLRKTYPKTAAAEVAWFLLGQKDVSFIRKYSNIWNKFVEDDGDTVAGAYGHRWRANFGRDQIGDAVKALTDNPTDRRIFVSAWDPAKDGLGRPSKNVPCPVGFTLSIVSGRLNSTLLIRSSDVFVGLPYDIMGHALLMKALQASITLAQEGLAGEGKAVLRGLGKMHVTLAHPHLYTVHRDMADTALSCLPADPIKMADQARGSRMPEWGLKRIVSIPDSYVELIATRAQGPKQPDFSCRPELVV
jgi:thymidylate synthase